MAESAQKQSQVKSLAPFSSYHKLRLKETDLNDVVRTMEDSLPQRMQGTIVAKVALAKEDLMIMADMLLMREALRNLVQNALDAMPNGGMLLLKTGRVNAKNGAVLSHDGMDQGPWALISIADTGVGIDERIKEKIFEPFFTTKEGSDRGLGLPMAYRIIREHGGSMMVESGPGHGTAVDVYLPLVKTQRAQMMPVPLPGHWGRPISGEMERPHDSKALFQTITAAGCLR
jgi:two-component system, cell cycle sensor histidine kinase and response regulator CckA